jgi:hypothetical protein
VGELQVRRPDSLGLDVRRAEAILGRRLPGLSQVAAAVAGRHRQGRVSTGPGIDRKEP